METPLEELLKKLDPRYKAGIVAYLGDIQAADPDSTFEISLGRKYTKVISNCFGQTQVFCFIDPTNGDLYKAATWAQPAKGVRGNIYNEYGKQRPLTQGQFYKTA